MADARGWYVEHPFRDAPDPVSLPSSITLDDALGRMGVEPREDAPLRVAVNGDEVPLEQWSALVVDSGDEIVATHAPRDPISALFGFFLSAFGGATLGAPVAGVVVPNVFGFIGAGIATAGVVGGAVYGVSVALRSLLGIPDQSNVDFEDVSQSPSLKGTQNRSRLNSPVMRNLGRNRITAALGSLPHTETIGSDQYQRVIMDFGYGPGTPDEASMRFGDTPIADTETEYVIHRGDGEWKHVYTDGSSVSTPAFGGTESTYDETKPPVLRIATADVKEDVVNVHFKPKWFPAGGVITSHAHTMTQEGHELGIELFFPQGLGRVDGAGKIQGMTLAIQIEVRKDGVGPWLGVTSQVDWSGNDGKHLSAIAQPEGVISGTFGIETLLLWDQSRFSGPHGKGVFWYPSPGSVIYDGGPISSVTLPAQIATPWQHPLPSRIVQTSHLHGKRWRVRITRDTGSFIDDGVIPGGIYKATGFGFPADTYVRVAQTAESVTDTHVRLESLLDANLARLYQFEVTGLDGFVTHPNTPYVPASSAPTGGRALDAEETGGLIQLWSNTRQPIRQGFKFEAPQNIGTYEVRVQLYHAPWAYNVREWTNDRDGRGNEDNSTPSMFVDFIWTLARAFRRQPALLKPGNQFVELRSKATDHLNGQIKNFNMIWTSHLWRINAAGTAIDPRAATRSPAYAALDCLLGPACENPIEIADAPNLIDLPAWREWFENCRPVEQDLRYDRVHDFDSSQAIEIQKIAAIGRATIDHREKWRPVMDKEHTPVVYRQALSPLNTQNLRYEKEWNETPHAIRAKFRNEDKDYQTDTLTVYQNGFAPLDNLASAANVEVIAPNIIRLTVSPQDDAWRNTYGLRPGGWVKFPTGFDGGPNASVLDDEYVLIEDINSTPTASFDELVIADVTLVAEAAQVVSVSATRATKIETIGLHAIVRSHQVVRDLRLRDAVRKLRPEIFKFRMGWEYLNLKIGDICPLSHFVLRVGIDWGRVDSFVDGGTFINWVELQSPVRYQRYEGDPPTVINYVAQFMALDGTLSTWEIRNAADAVAEDTFDSTRLIFVGASKPPTGTVFERGEHVVIGPSATKTLDVMIRSIEAHENSSAEITAVPYSPEIFSYTDLGGDLPDYDPHTTRPALSPEAPPKPPEILALVGRVKSNEQGELTRDVLIRWLAVSSFRDGANFAATSEVEVQWRFCGEGARPATSWQTKGTFPVDDLETVLPFEEDQRRRVDVRIRAVSEFGVTSQWAPSKDGQTVRLYGEIGRPLNLSFREVVLPDPVQERRSLRITWDYPQPTETANVNMSCSSATDIFGANDSSGPFTHTVAGNYVEFQGFENAANNRIWKILTKNSNDQVVVDDPDGLIVSETTKAGVLVRLIQLDDDDLPIRPAAKFLVQWRVNGGRLHTRTVEAHQGTGENGINLDASAYGFYDVEVSAISLQGEQGRVSIAQFYFSPQLIVDLPAPRRFRVKGSPIADPGLFTGRNCTLEWDPVVPESRRLDFGAESLEADAQSQASDAIDCYVVRFFDASSMVPLTTEFVLSAVQRSVDYTLDANTDDSKALGLPRGNFIATVSACDKAGNIGRASILRCHNEPARAPTASASSYLGFVHVEAVRSEKDTDFDEFVTYGIKGSSYPLSSIQSSHLLHRSTSNNYAIAALETNEQYTMRVAVKDVFRSHGDVGALFFSEPFSVTVNPSAEFYIDRPESPTQFAGPTGTGFSTWQTCMSVTFDSLGTSVTLEWQGQGQGGVAVGPGGPHWDNYTVEFAIFKDGSIISASTDRPVDEVLNTGSIASGGISWAYVTTRGGGLSGKVANPDPSSGSDFLPKTLTYTDTSPPAAGTSVTYDLRMRAKRTVLSGPTAWTIEYNDTDYDYFGIPKLFADIFLKAVNNSS